MSKAHTSEFFPTPDSFRTPRRGELYPANGREARRYLRGWLNWVLSGAGGVWITRDGNNPGGMQPLPLETSTIPRAYTRA